MKRIVPLVATVAWCSLQAFGQGMPAEARENIHALLNNHTSITRSVTLTDDGYVSKTESNDTTIARTLREHVAQMESRLASGLMVRRWDPAFAEYVRHYDQMQHTMSPTPAGLTMTVRGTTPEAVTVAQNHAEIVTDFVTNGWEGHNRTHPAVYGSADGAKTDSASCCESGCGNQMCGQKKGGQGAHKHGRPD